MKKLASRLLYLGFTAYFGITMYIMTGYAKEIDKMFLVNSNLLNACVSLDKGEDLQ